MFNLAHLLYMAISAVIIVILLVLAGIFVRDRKYQNWILRCVAIVTVIIHFSPLYVDFFTTGTAVVESPMLLPIYPCNVMMWSLLICAFVKKPERRISQMLFEFTFFVGVFCGIVGIVFNENYGNNPNLADWGILKGLLSHSTMLFGCLYLLVGGYFKVRVKNCVSVFCGLCLFLIDGFILNGLYLAFGLGELNSMYLQHPPLAAYPFFNTFVMGILGIILVFIITAIFETIAVKQDERWTTVIKNKFKEKEHN